VGKRLRQILSLSFNQILDWFTSPRILVALALGIVFTYVDVANFMRYVAMTKESVQIFEPYIYLMSNYGSFSFILLGFVLLISDAPFVSQRSLYAVVRCTRKRWVSGMMVYILLSALIYFGIVLLASMVFVTSNAYIADIWSAPMYSLAAYQPQGAWDIGVAFPYLEMLRVLSPAAAGFQTLALNILYGTMLGMLVFVINLNNRRLIGSFVAVGVHAVGWIMISETIFSLPLFSPLYHAVLVTHAFGSMNPTMCEAGTSIYMFIVIIAILSVVGGILSKRSDFRASAGDKQ
jgi:hypothetical protein